MILLAKTFVIWIFVGLLYARFHSSFLSRLGLIGSCILDNFGVSRFKLSIIIITGLHMISFTFGFYFKYFRMFYIKILMTSYIDIDTLPLHIWTFKTFGSNSSTWIAMNFILQYFSWSNFLGSSSTTESNMLSLFSVVLNLAL